MGKTVLLNKIETIAEERGYLTSLLEAPEDRPLPALLYPMLQQTLRKLSLSETAKAAAYFGMRALRSFAKTFKVEVGDFSIAVDPEPGVADSGNLEFDLPELFVRIGEAAKAAGRGWVLLIDELQYLKQADLSALIVATHKITQRNLPVLVFGADCRRSPRFPATRSPMRNGCLPIPASAHCRKRLPSLPFAIRLRTRASAFPARR